MYIVHIPYHVDSIMAKRPQRAVASTRDGIKAGLPKAAKRFAPRNPRGRPRGLSEELLLDAALRIMGRAGHQKLTVRSLAKELGISHAALYTYIDSIEQIEERAKRKLTDQLPRPQSSSGPELRKELLAYLQSMRVMMLLHRGVVLCSPGSSNVGLFRDISKEWDRALLPYAANRLSLDAAMSGLVGTVLLFVEGERIMATDLTAGKGSRSPREAPSVVIRPEQIEPYLDKLIELLFPRLSSEGQIANTTSHKRKS